MNKFKITKVMVTKLGLFRENLITKEKMENYCKGEENVKQSVNDDLESFFDDIRQKKVRTGSSWTYFLPKLTKEELNLVERQNNNFMQTFLLGMRANVDKAEMEASESDSKFVRGMGWRQTFILEHF